MPKMYPLSIDVNVHITNGDAEGKACFRFGVGRLPTDDDVPAILENVLGQLPDGFRLMTRSESAMFYLRDARGYRGPNMVIPRAKDAPWFDPSTDDDFPPIHDEAEAGEDEE